MGIRSFRTSAAVTHGAEQRRRPSGTLGGCPPSTSSTRRSWPCPVITSRPGSPTVPLAAAVARSRSRGDDRPRPPGRPLDGHRRADRHHGGLAGGGARRHRPALLPARRPGRAGAAPQPAARSAATPAPTATRAAGASATPSASRSRSSASWRAVARPGSRPSTRAAPAERASAGVASPAMRLHVVSDVHGNDRALARAADGADGLSCSATSWSSSTTGTPSRGSWAACSARRSRPSSPGCGPPACARRWSSCSSRRGRASRTRGALLREVVAEHYAQTFTVLEKLDVPVWAIPGNVDMPAMWPGDSAVSFVDGTVRGPRRAAVRLRRRRPAAAGRCRVRDSGPWRPHFLTDEVFDAAVSALGPVDVLCSHAPPAVPDLAYDVVARRREGVGPGAARADRRRPPVARAVRARAPAARAAQAGRGHGVRERRALPA